MKLEWGAYKHFPYEKELALREISALIGNDIHFGDDGHVFADIKDVQNAQLLTYFASFSVEGKSHDTVQKQLEQSASSSNRKQSTRYSVHGLHEYRGKFNPQVCRALMNILAVPRGGVLLDPFCGSGTTLIEAAHSSIRSVGTDLNPLAVFIANAKLKAIQTPADQLADALQRIVRRESTISMPSEDNARHQYLCSWFEPEILTQIERIRAAIEIENEDVSSFFFVIASNLLREFSLQEPADLRIRRRPTANAKTTFLSSFEAAGGEAIRKLQAAQKVVGTSLALGRAYLKDNRDLTGLELPELADAAITSPPYATALPYIDTQRLSLVWLSLLHPKDIGRVEADLTGSREISSQAKREAFQALEKNDADLPEAEWELCIRLQRALTENDGFRRKAAPTLLYRYFNQMRLTFRAVSSYMKVDAPFALIVGHNHTVLGGTRFDIDTPQHLVSLANSVGWRTAEVTPLQAYQRFGLHSSNAVQAETLVVLRNQSPGG